MDPGQGVCFSSLIFITKAGDQTDENSEYPDENFPLYSYNYDISYNS